LHSIRELLGLLSKFLDSVSRSNLSELLRHISEEYRDALRVLDEAYTASRYLPKTYELEDAEKAIRAVDALLEALNRVEDSLFR